MADSINNRDKFLLVIYACIKYELIVKNIITNLNMFSNKFDEEDFIFSSIMFGVL